MTLKLKIGNRYVRRDGSVTDPLIVTTNGGPSFPFTDPDTLATFTASGTYWLAEVSDEDLIREYKPEWRVVIKCESRKQARTVKGNLQGWFDMDKITVEKSS